MSPIFPGQRSSHIRQLQIIFLPHGVTSHVKDVYPRLPLWSFSNRELLHLQSHSFHSIHSYLSESTTKELFHNQRENSSCHPCHPMWMEILNMMGFSLIPQRDHLWHCHSVFGIIPSTLAWVYQSPVSQCVPKYPPSQYPLHSIPSTPFTIST